MWSSQLGIKDPKSMTQICISVKGFELGSVVLCMVVVGRYRKCTVCLGSGDHNLVFINPSYVCVLGGIYSSTKTVIKETQVSLRPWRRTSYLQ